MKIRSSIATGCLGLLCLPAHAEDLALPLPVQGLEQPAQNGGAGFLKPTKSIKPPVLDTGATALAAVQPQVNAPTVRLRRLILVPGTLPPEELRQTLLAGGQSRLPLTVVGMNAPAPVFSKLAAFFGSDVTADAQKQIIETVRTGLQTPGTKAPGRVEIVGWIPAEGVMAVAVYPES